MLGLNRDDSITFNGTMGQEDRYTLGGRVWGNIADTGLDFDLEGAYQFGELGSADISAFMIATEVGYRFENWSGTPRLHVGAGYASGDDTAGGDVETFNHLFPLGHAYLGYIDTVGRQNAIDLNAGLTVKPLKKLTVRLTGHLFWRADTDDALYDAGGAVVRAGALGNDREIGSEIDLVLKYAFDRHLSTQLGYSYFFAGDFINQSGADDDIGFFHMTVQFKF